MGLLSDTASSSDESSLGSLGGVDNKENSLNGAVASGTDGEVQGRLIRMFSSISPTGLSNLLLLFQKHICLHSQEMV